MTVKLCPHFETLPRWASKIDYPGSWVKVMNPGAWIGRRFPGQSIVGRWYVREEERYIAQGAEGAEAYFELLRPHYEETWGDVTAIEAINEPGCNTLAQVDVLGRFLLRWMELMHARGLHTAVPAFSVGNPESWVLGALREVYALTDYATLHEYGARRLDDRWNEFAYTSLRHRTLVQYMREHEIRVPPLLITECGIDRGGDGYRKKPGATQWPEYLRQLVWYENELRKDDYVIAGFVFTSGATRAWKSFDVGEGEWRDLARALG